MRRHSILPIQHLRRGGMLPILHYKNGKYLSQHHLRLAKEQGNPLDLRRTTHHRVSGKSKQRGSGIMLDDVGSPLPQPPLRKSIKPLKFRF